MNALAIITTGFEELELVAPIDYLRRANVEVTLASTEDNLRVSGRNHISISADCLISDLPDQAYDLLLLPGGPSVFQLRERTDVMKLIQTHHRAGKWIAAICAAPLLLKDAGVLEDQSYCAHASTHSELPLAQDQSVVVHNKLITSPGAGRAIEFALAIIHHCISPQTARQLAQETHA